MEKIAGFKLIEKRELKEEKSLLLYFEHEKTGARLYHMKNDDDNKVFSIGFMTPPLASTGNCHILEHSVLNGSRKYRTKEPFMDVLKTSLSTFLNAMTFPDKTIYPVASRNDADFKNLMDLYLDAVFFPAVKNNELIFRQEGWHYHIMDKNDPITYSGVVYNEMRGAMSAADDQIEDAIKRVLFSGSIYESNSGGDPYHIPDLTYDEFIKYHDTYYHPSNSYIFLYGNMDMEKSYKHISSYLDEFDKKEVNSMPNDVEKFTAPKETEIPFSIASDDDAEGKGYLSLSWLVDHARTDTQRYLYKMLSSALINSESSPLRRALFEELGALDVRSSLNDVKEIGFSIIVKGVEADKKDLFLKIVNEKLEEMVKNGLDKKALEGIVQGMEYEMREKGGSATKGITFLFQVLNEGLYGHNPMDLLQYEKQLEELKKMLNEGGLEKYIEERLLNNPHRSLIIHKATPGLNVSRDKEVAEKLKAYKESLSADELDDLINENLALEERQNSFDSPEDMETIPMLSFEDLPTSITTAPREVVKKDYANILLHDMNTSGIIYLDLVFNMDHIAFEDLPYLSLIAHLLGDVDSKKHDYEEYAKLEAIYTGGIVASCTTVEKYESRNFNTIFKLSSKFLGSEHLKEGLDLVFEQLGDSDFSDIKRIRELININLAMLESQIIPAGSSFAMNRASSRSNMAMAFDEEMSGLSFYMFLKEKAKNFDEKDLEKLKSIYSKISLFPKRIVNLTASSDLIERSIPLIEDRMKDLKIDMDIRKASRDIELKQVKEGFTMASDVQFSALSAPFHMEKTPYNGAYVVLSNILSNIYLYMEVRAKGGAYGQGMKISQNDIASVASYRDPHLARTIDVFNAMPDFIDSLDMYDEELMGFIIGAIGNFDQPLTEVQLAKRDLFDYIRGLESGFYDKALEEIKNTKVSDLKGLADQLEDFLKRSSLAVIGSKEKLEGYDFDELVNL